MINKILSIIEKHNISRHCLAREKALEGVFHHISVMRYLRGEGDTTTIRFEALLKTAEALVSRRMTTVAGEAFVCIRLDERSNETVALAVIGSVTVAEAKVKPEMEGQGKKKAENKEKTQEKAIEALRAVVEKQIQDAAEAKQSS